MKAELEMWLAWASSTPEKLAQDIHQKVGDLPDHVRRAAIAWLPTEDILAAAIKRGAAANGPLAGLPYALKDLFDVAGVPTRAGSDFLAEVRSTPAEDSLIVQKLQSLGATLAAKTGTVEFAYGLSGENKWYGDVPHPHIKGALAGGSSSGSAWAVAHALTPFAIGTDTAGSMRVPAAYCGIYSFRDAPGPYTQQCCFPLAPSYDTPGWFARAIDIMRTLNECLLVPGRKIDAPRVLNLTELSPNLDPRLREAGAALLRKLDAQRDESAASVAFEAFADCARAYNILGSREAYAVHAQWLDQYRDRYDPVIWGRIDRGRRWHDGDIAWAEKKEMQVLAAWEKLFSKFDVVAMPVTPVPSPGKDAMTEDYRAELLSLTTPGSLGRCPALTIPVMLDNGSSGGLQLLFPRDAAHSLAASMLRRLE